MDPHEAEHQPAESQSLDASNDESQVVPLQPTEQQHVQATPTYAEVFDNAEVITKAKRPREGEVQLERQCTEYEERTRKRMSTSTDYTQHTNLSMPPGNGHMLKTDPNVQ